jgi:Acyl-coenzyme A:6-aminopenicillanic acid acyl-transferase
MAAPAKTLRVSFVQCRGTPYEVGRAQANTFAMTRKGKAFLRKRVRLPWWLNIRAEERAFKVYAPALREKIGGVAEGLDIPMEQAVANFGNDGLRMPTGGCSAVMSCGVYGRNYDFRPRQYEARFALVQARGSYASVGGSHQLTGRLDGMNEHATAITRPNQHVAGQAGTRQLRDHCGGNRPSASSAPRDAVQLLAARCRRRGCGGRGRGRRGRGARR